MNHGRLTKGLAVASLTGVAVLGTSAPALAQYEGPGRSSQAPGQGNKADCPADPNRNGQPGRCGRGAQMSANSGQGTFDPGSQGRFGVESSFRQLGTFATSTRVNPDGSVDVSFTVPDFLEDGTHNVVFLGVKNGLDVVVRVPFTVSGGTATAAPGSVTSAGGVPITITGAAAPGSTAAGTTAPGTAAAGTAAPGTAAAGTAAPGTDGTAGRTGVAGSTSTTGTGTTVAGRALPRTGSDSLVELTAAGIALVAVGGIVVVAARRRRADVGGLAL